jgi:hypothetical protein
MTTKTRSLISGRNRSALSNEDQRRVINTFLGLDKDVNVRYVEGETTGFRVNHEESGEEFGEIICGPDIFPGTSIVDPNSILGLTVAAVHELSHYYRWKDKTELQDRLLEHLDEALTSLQAILRYHTKINDTDVRQLVSDAAQRLQLYIETLEESKADDPKE